MFVIPWALFLQTFSIQNTCNTCIKNETYSTLLFPLQNLFLCKCQIQLNFLRNYFTSTRIRVFQAIVYDELHIHYDELKWNKMPIEKAF